MNTLVSSDSHIFEPPDLWLARLGSDLRDQAPRIVEEATGDWWYLGDRRLAGMGPASNTGKRFEHPEDIKREGRYINIRPGANVPDARLKDLDEDGVYAEVLYPTVGLQLFCVTDSELLTPLCAAYNDWLAEFCASHPKRLKGVALLNVDDVPGAVAELRRARGIGLSGALIPVFPRADAQYDSPEYEPLWAAAADLDVPLGMHTSTIRPSSTVARDPVGGTPASEVNIDYYVRMSLAAIILSGVFDRHPKLQVGTVEHGLGWIPYFLDSLDYTYTQIARRPGWHRFKDGVLPSDVFSQHVFCSFQEDALGIRERKRIGLQTLMWASDYPHTASTYPRSRQIVERQTAGIPAAEIAQIGALNTCRLYHIDLPAEAAV